MQDCYAKLKADVKEKYDTVLTDIGSIGFSAMMHGYLAFDKSGKLLVPFRTWRNTITEEASNILTKEFNYHIPQRWSIAHLYQAILNKEPHVKDVDFFTTLDGYVHWVLTGERVLGIGEASGMFPIDLNTKDYNASMIEKFNELAGSLGFTQKLEDIMPKVLLAGDSAGILSEEGAKMLDPDGDLKSGIKLCPPEGDAGTGMTATNSISKRTGNISAGTSVFAMVVLDEDLKKVYEEIDLVTTPTGNLVGMVHCNNCTSDINAWVKLFKEYQELLGIPVDMNDVYAKLYNHALTGNADCGGIMAYNFISGEPVAGLQEGRPMFLRSANDKFNLANFMRANLYGTVAVLKLGNDILFKEEKVKVDRITGHGGLFKTPGVGQKVLAAAINSPISVMETAGEGGAWGIALLAAYLINNKGMNLADYLETIVFAGNTGVEIQPDSADVEGFNKYIETYKACIPVAQKATECKK